MAVYTRQLLSGSTSGRPIVVTGTATGSGVTLHTAISGTTSIDEVTLYASNVTTSVATITIEWGGVTDPGDHIVKALAIQPNSPPVLIVAGLPMQNGLLIKAFGSTGSAINITGKVTRIQG